MTPDEIHALEQRMDALAREYGTTHDPEILASSCWIVEHRAQAVQRSLAVAVVK
jgi:hypothetical protein